MSLRHHEILALAQSEGKVTVEALAARFGVTLQTIRRDLSDLAESGQLERVHGGAVPASGTTNIAYEERRRLNEAAKARIGQAAAAHITSGSCIYLSIGTTAEAVARALAGQDNLMVVTNNTNVAAILAPHAEIEVLVTGGTLRHADGGLTGPLTLSAIESFRFDLAVMGCSAIGPQGTVLDYDMNEVQIARAAIAHARRRFLITDHSKFQRSAPIRVADLAQFDHLITDAPLPADLQDSCPSTEIV